MELNDIFLLIGALGLLYIGISRKFKESAAQRERDEMFKRNTEKIQELTKLADDAKKKIEDAKVDYEKAKNKLVVLAVHDGDKPDGDGSRE